MYCSGSKVYIVTGWTVTRLHD